MARPQAKRSRPGGKGVKLPPPRADNRSTAVLGGVDLRELRRLIRLVQRTGIGELELGFGGRTVRISAHAVPGASVAPASAGGVETGARVADKADVEKPADDTTVAITSPMVGTFYHAPAPDEDPYVEVGDRVEIGQTVCIVEAMKLMNEIESEVRGRVVQVLVENSHPVEFGQKLFLVEPD